MAFPIDAPIEHLGDTHCGQAFPPDIAEEKYVRFGAPDIVRLF
jgi:hypothetical protein